MTLIRLNVEPKIENKLVLKSSKLEPERKKKTSQTKSKPELKNNEGCF